MRQTGITAAKGDASLNEKRLSESVNIFFKKDNEKSYLMQSACSSQGKQGGMALSSGFDQAKKRPNISLI